MGDTPSDYTKCASSLVPFPDCGAANMVVRPQDVMDDQDYDDITAEVHAEAGLSHSSPVCGSAMVFVVGFG